MQKKPGSSSVLIGISLLFLVVLGMGGVAYSFYRTEIAQEKEESSDMANDDSPFEQLKKEKNMVITPVEQEQGGSVGIDSSPPIDSNPSGIPTGTYSNPPDTVTSTGSSYSTETNSPIDSLGSSVESNRLNQQKTLSNTIPDYSNPSSSNNFNNTSENSLIQPLDDDEFLETPSSSTDEEDSLETPSLTESSF